MKKILFDIAFRNVRRRKLQTTLISIMIIFTTFAIFAMVGMQSGAFKMLEDGYTKMFNGDIQIRNIDYTDEDAYKVLISDVDVKSVEKEIKNYKNTEVNYTKRNMGFAVAEAKNKNYSFLLVGIDPDTEKNVSQISQSMVKGNFLTAQDVNSVIIGEDLADFLKVSIGDEIVMMMMDIYDSFIIEPFIVTGIFKVGDMMLDKNYAFVNRNFFVNNLTYGDSFTNITLKLKDSSYRKDLLNNLKDISNKENLTTKNQKIEILPWDEVLLFLKQVMNFNFIISNVYYFVFILLVAFTVLNSMVLSTIKRMPEFGILSAVGLNNNQFKWILIYENLILCGLSVIIGSLLGMAFVYYFSLHGVPLPPPPEDAPLKFGSGDSRRLYPDPTSIDLIYGPIVIFISCFFSIIPSVIRLNRSNPVQSLTSI